MNNAACLLNFNKVRDLLETNCLQSPGKNAWAGISVISINSTSMNKHTAGILVALVGALSSMPSAQATIIGGSVTGGQSATAGGTFIKLTPPVANPFGTPNSVGNDTFQSPNLYGVVHLCR